MNETPLLDLLLLDFLAEHTGPEDDAATQAALLAVWKELRSCYHTESREPAQQQPQWLADMKEQTLKAQAAQIEAMNNTIDKLIGIIEKMQKAKAK